jgi:cardiolipin synthase
MLDSRAVMRLFSRVSVDRHQERRPDAATNALRDRALRVVREPVRLADLALAFDETVASTTDLQAGGKNFFPPMLEDIASATTSVHINQYGFRPGAIGERFATTLLAKAAEGVAVRLVVDGSGSCRGRSGHAFYERLRDGGIDVGVVRATRLRAPSQLGHIDHRKFVVVDGTVGWIGGAGIEDHFDDGRFHDLFLRLTGPVASQLQLVFLATFRWLGGILPEAQLEALFPDQGTVPGSVPATVLHNAPGSYRPITATIARLLDDARETLDVVNPYVTDRRMIERIERAARRGVCVRLFVPAKANNKACAAAQLCHHGALLAAGVRILGHPAMLHAKAFVRDREEVLIGTCNLDAWSLKRFFEIDVLVRSDQLTAHFDERFAAPAEAASTAGRAATGARERLPAAVFAAISPLL